MGKSLFLIDLKECITMEISIWIELIIRVLAGLAVIIPVVIELIKKTKSVVEEKNWSKIVNAVLKLMVEAEKQFTEGAAKKAWVMAGVRKVAETIDYNYDTVAEQKVADMIDAICEASIIINKDHKEVVEVSK